jgi:hypothetical protein
MPRQGTNSRSSYSNDPGLDPNGNPLPNNDPTAPFGEPPYRGGGPGRGTPQKGGPNVVPNRYTYTGEEGGVLGTPAQYGNNFIPMQSYLSANRNYTLGDAAYKSYTRGPNAGYTQNMHGLDSALYNFYGVTGGNIPTDTLTSPTPTPRAPQTQAEITGPVIGGGGDRPPQNDYGNNFYNMQRQMGYSNNMPERVA